jgi:hypothetical protein
MSLLIGLQWTCKHMSGYEFQGSNYIQFELCLEELAERGYFFILTSPIGG